MALVTNNISGSASDSSKIGITGSLIIANVPAVDFPSPPIDSKFFVSGTYGTQFSAKSVFGGDLVGSGSVKARFGFSGSLTNLYNGDPYLIGGSNITITSQSNGSITISAQGAGGGFEQAFDESDLTAGVLSVSHGISNADYVHVSVYDNNDKLIIPDEIEITGVGTLDVYLNSFRTDPGPSLPGTWHVFISTGGAEPGDPNTSIQFNDNGTFGGDINFTFDKNNDRVHLTGSFSQGLQTYAYGAYSHAEGEGTLASGNGSHAEGFYTTGSNLSSHAEGERSVAAGVAAHAEGCKTYAQSGYSHTEGYLTTGSGVASHAEGLETVSLGYYSHAEGYLTTGSGVASHAEGRETVSLGNYSHAEGNLTVAYAIDSHAEGVGSISSGSASHAEGWNTISEGLQSHSEGDATKSYGARSHAEGYSTVSSGSFSHAEGRETVSIGDYSHSEGWDTIASGTYSHAEGYNTIASGTYSHAEGIQTIAAQAGTHAEGQGSEAIAIGSHAEGYGTFSSGTYSHSEGRATVTTGSYSHAEGFYTIAEGGYSHSEGYFTKAYGAGSHAEGRETVTSGSYSHAEGSKTLADGSYSHAEGYLTTGSGDYSHAEGRQTLASGEYSHTQGYLTTGSGDYSFAGGYGTIASGDYQTVIGKYNDSIAASTVPFIIGNGTESDRKNIVVVTDDGITINREDDDDAVTTTGDENTYYVLLKKKDFSGFTKYRYTWGIGIDSSERLYFSYGSTSDLFSPGTPTLNGRGYISTISGPSQMNFTGQHRSSPKIGEHSNYTDKVGFIVISTGFYSPISGSQITINDAVPVIEFSTNRNDKRCFGVISDVEDAESTVREFGMGRFVSVYEKQSSDDNRIFVNSLGEGCVWVCNINGNLQNGDYITTCEIPGMGMKQDDDLLHNYTVAKITCDCNFDLNSDVYKCEEFIHEGVTYRRAFVGCTYHCG